MSFDAKGMLWLLWALIPLWIVGGVWVAYRKHSLGRLSLASSLINTKVSRWLLFPPLIAWALGVVALAEPIRKWDGRRPEGEVVSESFGEKGDTKEGWVRRPAHDVVFLLDASASMEVPDTRLGTSRLEFAKEIIDEVASQLDGQSVALYAFTSELTSIVPLTMDALYFRLHLRRVGINEGDAAGTDLIEALDAVKRRHGAHKEKARTLVLLTDGGDTRLESAVGEERQKELQVILSRIDAEGGFRVHCIGLGSHEGAAIPNLEFEGAPVSSTLDEELLQALAARGRGRYLFANDFSSLIIAEQLVDEIHLEEQYVEEARQLSTVAVERVVEDPEPLKLPYYRWPLLGAIIAVAFCLSADKIGGIRWAR